MRLAVLHDEPHVYTFSGETFTDLRPTQVGADASDYCDAGIEPHRGYGLVRAFPAWRFLKVLAANSSSRCGQRRTTNEMVPVGASNDHDVPLRLETYGSAPRVR